MNESFWSSPAAMAVAVTLAAALIGVAIFLVVRPRRDTIRDRVVRFLIPGTRKSSEPEDGRSSAPRGPIERWFGGSRWWARLNDQLDIARIDAPAGRIVAATALGTLLVGILIVAGIGAAILAPLALFVPVFVWVALRKAVARQREAFAETLADNLQLVASALRAGQSMAGAFAVVVDEADEPAKSEFDRIVTDERVGVPLEDAIRSVATRMDSRDLEQVALVAMIQRETGGNTAEILDRVIETIRERRALQRTMKTLTAQGRLTQIVVSALPLALLVGITILNPEYMDPLLHTSGGQIALGLGAVLAVTGSFLIGRIVNMEA